MLEKKFMPYEKKAFIGALFPAVYILQLTITSVIR